MLASRCQYANGMSFPYFMIISKLTLLHRYVFARDWDDLWRALRAGDKTLPSHLDELLLIHDLRKEAEKTIPGIKTVTYTNDPSGLLAKLHGDSSQGRNRPPQLTPASDRQNKAADVVSSQAAAPDISTSRVSEEDLPTDDVQEQDEEENLLSSTPPTEQLKAAEVILRAYRKYIELKFNRAAYVILKAWLRYRTVRQRRLRPIDECRRRWKAKCLDAQPASMQQSYRLHYLVHLPRALVCLERIKSYAVDCKTDAKQRLKSPTSRLEDVNEDLNSST